MRLPDTSNAARSLAVQTIGRNVVHFQRMEAALKLLVAFGRLEESVSEIQARLSKQTRIASSITMGTLAPRLVDTPCGKVDETAVVIPRPIETAMSISMCLEGGEEDAEQHSGVGSGLAAC